MGKSLYKGIFNFHNELKREFKKAHSLEQARLLMVRDIAKEHEVSPITVFTWLEEHPGSYEIKLEIQNGKENQTTPQKHS